MPYSFDSVEQSSGNQIILEVKSGAPSMSFVVNNDPDSEMREPSMISEQSAIGTVAYHAKQMIHYMAFIFDLKKDPAIL